ncbi:hypothetical protein Hanom_Chr08g00746811 [Helianthus anomalus]
MSSIRRIVIAASVANCSILTLLIAGSITPASKLLRTVPFIRSNPILDKCFLSALVCAVW